MSHLTKSKQIWSSLIFTTLPCTAMISFPHLQPLNFYCTHPPLPLLSSGDCLVAGATSQTKRCLGHRSAGFINMQRKREVWFSGGQSTHTWRMTWDWRRNSRHRSSCMCVSVHMKSLWMIISISDEQKLCDVRNGSSSLQIQLNTFTEKGQCCENTAGRMNFLFEWECLFAEQTVEQGTQLSPDIYSGTEWRVEQQQ